jgi:hypothetical protein
MHRTAGAPVGQAIVFTGVGYNEKSSKFRALSMERECIKKPEAVYKSRIGFRLM